ncbi:MAG: restriction endonuclease [Nanoarchaeota archaeon]
MNSGTVFEDRVADAYHALPDVHRIRRNVRKGLCDRLGRLISYCEIDLMYKDGNFQDRFVEVKYREHSFVSLEEVAKFKGVLDLLHIDSSRGEMVTNSGYLARAKAFAKLHHILLYDGDDLNAMKRYERRRASFLDQVWKMPDYLEGIILARIRKLRG